MAKYKHLSIPPEDFVPIEQLTMLFNSTHATDLSAPRIVVMAVKRVLADMEGQSDDKG